MPAPKFNPHYTLADYQQWEGSWELWRGVAVAMIPSPFGRHQWVAGQWLTRLNTQLAAVGCDDCFVVAETDWVIDQDMVVRPDVALICGGFPEQFIDRPPALIIEVLSESTASKDRGAKRELYESEGVQFYLIAAPNDPEVEIFELVSGRFEQLPANVPVEIVLHPGCSIQLDRTPFRMMR